MTPANTRAVIQVLVAPGYAELQLGIMLEEGKIKACIQAFSLE
ncbi:hypothetical protein [Desulfogranum marinum]|nr:hypothetical protein [Desulfogranum marinum]